MILPARWEPVHRCFQLLLESLCDLDAPGHFVIEANGPDGTEWTDLRRCFVALDRADPAVEATRAVAGFCGGRRELLDPPPAGQSRRGLYYAPASFSAKHREDAAVRGLSAIVLDIDDRNHGSRDGTLAALSRAPAPTFVVHSGGGVQAGYVLREALAFDRADDVALKGAARDYLAAALALEEITGADATHWPSHLFRCPGAYHLKVPHRPVMVTADIQAERRFNLSDFEDCMGCVELARLDGATDDLVAKLRGERRAAPTGSGVLTPLKGRVRLPRRVSRKILQLLNEGIHPDYTHPSGLLDRSRAVAGAATSLLAAGIAKERVVRILASSALRGAVDDRGDYGPLWLRKQVQKAATHLAAVRSAERAS